MDTDLITGVDHTILTGLEFAAYLNQFRLQAEYIGASVSYLDESKSGEKFNGFYVFGSMLLFGGKYNYNTRLLPNQIFLQCRQGISQLNRL